VFVCRNVDELRTRRHAHPAAHLWELRSRWPPARSYPAGLSGMTVEAATGGDCRLRGPNSRPAGHLLEMRGCRNCNGMSLAPTRSSLSMAADASQSAVLAVLIAPGIGYSGTVGQPRAASAMPFTTSIVNAAPAFVRASFKLIE